MKTLTNLVIVAAVAFAGTSAMASGFKCQDTKDMGYNVKLFNKTVGGTRIPAVFILSNADASPSTLLRRGEGEISKSNRLNTVRYTVHGNSKVAADTVILQISFKEGLEVLSAGEEVDGQLILAQDSGDREVIALTCERYLKGE